MYPNITFTISILSHFLNNPRDVHWEAVKHIYHYLKFTKNMSLTYSSNQYNLKGYIVGQKTVPIFGYCGKSGL